MPEPKNTPGAVDNSGRLDEPDIAPNKMIPGERAEVDSNKTKQEREIDPVLALINGQATTDNETVQYFVDKILALRTEARAVVAELREARKATASLEKRAAEIEIEANAYIGDAAHWNARPGATPPETP